MQELMTLLHLVHGSYITTRLSPVLTHSACLQDYFQTQLKIKITIPWLYVSHRAVLQATTRLELLMCCTTST